MMKNLFCWLTVALMILFIFSAQQNQQNIPLSNAVIQGLQGETSLRKVTLDVLIQSEEKIHPGFPRRNQDRMKILPFLIHKQKNGKIMVVSRGQLRDTRRSSSSEFGANHSGRTRASAWIRRFEFTITHLLQRASTASINLTEIPSGLSGPLSWAYPEIQLSIICVRKKQIISCPRKGVRMVESPRFLFHTFP